MCWYVCEQAIADVPSMETIQDGMPFIAPVRKFASMGIFYEEKHFLQIYIFTYWRRNRETEYFSCCFALVFALFLCLSDILSSIYYKYLCIRSSFDAIGFFIACSCSIESAPAGSFLYLKNTSKKINFHSRYSTQSKPPICTVKNRLTWGRWTLTAALSI